MATSKLEDDEEVAENILNRIFYEEATQDMIVNILRDYSTQSLLYVNYLNVGV